MKLETIAVHAGKKPDPGSGAITSSIQLATTFERGADGAFSHGYIYARGNNPNRKALETCLAALEGGACAAAFASGSAASMASEENPRKDFGRSRGRPSGHAATFTAIARARRANADTFQRRDAGPLPTSRSLIMYLTTLQPVPSAPPPPSP